MPDTTSLLDDRVVLITGAGRGAGAGMARRLAARGARVAINYAASGAAAAAVVAEIREAGGVASAFRADVLDADAVAGMIAAVETEFGRVDAVVNNAVAGDQQVDFDDATPAHFTQMLDYACRAVVNTTKAALPAFGRAGGGRIVNVVSDFWNEAPGGWSPYVAAKGAMVGLSRSLASELGPRGVTVNMVAPGWMIADAADEASADSVAFAQTLPLRRRARPEDVGDVIAFYVSDLAGAVTGAYVLVDGGRLTPTGG